MLSKSLTATALLAMLTGSVMAAEITAEWTFTGQTTPYYIFHLDLQATALLDTYTTNGYAVHNSSNNREAVVGSATYSEIENVYVISLFFNSNTGESFSIGANLDPSSLSGSGNFIRVAHGTVGADQAGTFAITP